MWYLNVTVVLECISYNLCAYQRILKNCPSRCIDRHRESNYFERSNLAMLGAVAASCVGRKWTRSRIGNIASFWPLSDREKRARYLAAMNGKNGKRDRGCFYSVDSPDRSCYSCVRLLHLFTFFGGAAKWNASLSVHAVHSFSLSLSDRVFLEWVNTIEIVETSSTFVSGYCEILTAESSRIRVRGKSHQREMQLTKSDANKGIRFCSSNSWVIYYERAKLSTKLCWSEYFNTISYLICWIFEY